MAGIGFKLRKILSKGTYTSLITAYVYGAVISTGPWLISIISIGILSALCRGLLSFDQQVLFQTILVYTYMGTLIFTGPFYMSTTRYLADKMFLDDFPSVLPTFKYVSELCLLASLLVSGGFYLIGGMQFNIALVAIVLFEAVAITWVAMIFLSAARDYGVIVKIYLLGYLVGVLLGYLGAYYYDLLGMLWGFALGLFLLCVLLSARVYQEFPSQVRSDKGVLKYWKEMPWLMICGFAYNAALWVDKIIYWIASGKKAAPGPFYAPVDYDTCFFWAYLTIVPSMTIFLIRIETSFYKFYADFLGAVSGGATLAEIEKKKADIVDNLWLSISRILKLQGGVTGIAIFIAPYILDFVGMSSDLVVLLRYTFLAAFIQVLFLILIIVILYFDWKKLAAKLTLQAMFLNIAFSVFTAYYARELDAVGALAAFLVSLITGMYYFNKAMDDLIFETFASQSFET